MKRHLMKHKFGLLPKVLLAIALGIVFGLFVPEWFTRIALTFNNIFGNFLNFVIPLLSWASWLRASPTWVARQDGCW